VLHLVRHGRTAENAAGLLLGRADPPLDAVGRAQATALVAALPKPDRVVSSPLLRARQTAEAFGAPVSLDERWIELDYGTLDGTPLSETRPEIWEQWRADIAFVPAGGESLATLGSRVREACDALASLAADSEVVVVTHVSPLKASVAWALGVGDEVAWRLYVAPASITRIGVRDGRAVLRSFNEVAHLAELHSRG